MKTWLIIIITLAIGVGAGLAAGVAQLRMSPGLDRIEVDDLLASASTPKHEQLDAPPQPKVEIDQEEFDFGTMDSQSVGKHEFVLRNVGNAPLTFGKVSTTCKCTSSEPKKEKIYPGESTTVAIEWTPKGFMGAFEQTAKIETNDPFRPQLTLKVKGRITTVLHARPSELVFSRISAGQSARSSVRLYAYSSDSMEATGFELKESDTAKFFEVALAPLSAEQIREEPDAKSGYEIGVTVKPGLPQGPFQQTIRVDTNLASAPTIEVPVIGKVGSDISVLGRGWNEDRGVVKLGFVDSKRGIDRSLKLVARGRYRDLIEFEVVEVFPSGVLEAELGERTEINHGVATQTPLKLHIAKGAGPANHLGSKQGKTGRIVLDTNHPQMPRLTILVSFAIEGG